MARTPGEGLDSLCSFAQEAVEAGRHVGRLAYLMARPGQRFCLPALTVSLWSGGVPHHSICILSSCYPQLHWALLGKGAKREGSTSLEREVARWNYHQEVPLELPWSSSLKFSPEALRNAPSISRTLTQFLWALTFAADGVELGVNHVSCANFKVTYV